ncbi:rifin PIR protein,putative [Plasmodium sp. DRC-Itaito]|nr:rifin PIR protein,putative [Plasmodium sp. DRC-Itaito]
MKVNYINILLFMDALNILVNTHKKTSITHHTKTKRSLCECDLYMPNYDNDPQMKRVMQQFEDRTSQRFHEYDERMKTTRQKCKDKCDKESQKIILKDKLEKELMDKFATLDTNIQNDAIPTCVCEKSMADKVEKGCLRCGGVLGGGVAPGVGILGGIGQVALSAWKPAAFHLAMRAAMVEATAKGLAAGLKEGKEVVILALRYYKVHTLFPGIYDAFVKTRPYTEVTKLAGDIVAKHGEFCTSFGNSITAHPACELFELNIGMRIEDSSIVEAANKIVPKVFDTIVRDAKKSASDEAAKVILSKTAEIQETNLAAVDATYMSNQISIIASIVAIVVIVLIMVIIYLILRYRRKKKMKKKLQYIKLLEE